VRPGRETQEIPTGLTDQDGKPIWVEYRNIPRFVNDAYWKAYEWFVMTEVLAVPPYPGGWMDWPEVGVTVLAAFRTEHNIERQERPSHDD
jgi:hypothetical protein